MLLYHLDSGKTTNLTTDRVGSYSPAWSPDGKWIYFLSDRFFRSIVRSPWGPRQPEPFFDKTTKIYMTALQPGLRSPFLPDDEVFLSEKESKKKDDDKKEDGKSDKAKEDDKNVVRESKMRLIRF